MSENEDISSTARVKGDKVLKISNLKKKRKKKGITGEVDIKEDATYEEWDTLHIDKRKNIAIW